MLDTFSRDINYLRISLTNSCDLKCIYCRLENCQIKSSFMPISDCVSYCKAAANIGINKIRLTGGEPLLHPNIIEIINEIKNIDSIKNICLTTNGQMLDKLAKPINEAGVQFLNISIDSLNIERYRQITKGGDLNKTLSGLNKALQCNFESIKINVVLMKDINTDEVYDMIELTHKLPIQLRFIELMPMQSKDFFKRHYISSDFVIDTYKDIIPIKRSGVARLYKVSGYLGTIGLISPISHSFCSECTRLRITSEGNLLPCLHSSAKISLKGLKNSQLEEAIKRGISLKPYSHNLNEGKSNSELSMNFIGG